MSNKKLNDEEKRANYPYLPLSTALVVAKGVKELGGGKSPVSKSLLASSLGDDERSQMLVFKLASAKAFGLIVGRSDFVLSEIANKYFYPTDDKCRSHALLDMLERPKAFAQLVHRFDGSRLPEPEMLANILHQDSKVPESWAQRVGRCFVQSAIVALAIDSQGFLRVQAIRDNQLAKSVPTVETDRMNLTDTGSSATKATEVSSEAQNPVIDAVNRTAGPPAFVIAKSVWAFAHKTGQIRVETPENISPELWEKLNAYVQVLKPSKNE
jgi:hypothetical protein